MKIREIVKNIYLFNDVVNVYIIKNDKKAILIDFGSGDILNHLAEINVKKVIYVLHTHYHRDQCFGDRIAIEHGIKIACPAKEKKLFKNVDDFWKTKSYYDLYYFKPTFFASTYNIPVHLTFKSGDNFNWGPYNFEIMKTSGHTTESITYLLENEGKILAFTGDLIHSGGKVITYYDLEYIYNDNGEEGIKRSLISFKKILARKPNILLPSHGNPIRDPKHETKILIEKFKRVRKVFCSEFSGIDVISDKLKQKEIKPVNLHQEFPHIFHRGECPPFIIKGKSHNCILIDFAGDDFLGYRLNEFNNILNSLDINKIDFVIPTHYHDDHTAGIPLLQEKFNLKVYALENMVDVLENPTHYRLGCLIDQSIKVHRSLKDREILLWDEYEFQIVHFPGQTEYHMGLYGKIDGKSIFFVGDSLTQRTLVDRDTNVNCINFCRLGTDVGYMKCADILLEFNPEFLAISHYGIIKVNELLLKKFKEFVSEYEPLISEIVAQENPNMGFDPNWICFKPIRVISKPGEKFKTNILIRNYLNKKSQLQFSLILPNNWTANPAFKSLLIEPKTFVEFPITISIPKNENPIGRTIITADIIWNGNKLGPFPDLMVDHGYTPKETWMGWTPTKNVNQFIWILNSIKKSKSFFK